MPSDPYSIYAAPPSNVMPYYADPLPLAPTPYPAGQVGAFTRLSTICRSLPAGFSGVCQVIAAAGLGIVVAWNSLPAWVTTILTAAGIAVGTNILIDTDGRSGDDAGVLPFPGVQQGPIPGISVIGTWTANGVKFYRLADGRIAVQNSRGRWKIWRPKKPIVMFAGGAGNLRTFLRADSALNGQAKRLKKALDRRAGPRRARSRATSGGGGGGTTITKVE